jgi:threonine synthase
MRYISTRSTAQSVCFADAALRGLAEDGGLFIPISIPQYRSAVKNSISSMSFSEIGFETIKPFVEGEIPDNALMEIIEGAFNFEAPVVKVGSRGILELFHGPTAAFKDFGARFMARTFSYLRRGDSKPLTILVATSGDTGGAVASGFYGVEGIKVTVLYPKGRISPLQEKQIAGLGENISAIAVEGSFDDCQRMVKSAFSNKRICACLDMSSANSINISRLIPQAVYYAAASGKAAACNGEALLFCVPSGNFGNLTAGLYAREMGAPISGFIAATNINKTFPDYLESGSYKPCASVATISNAMDVGAPSNFERMQAHWPLSEMRHILKSFYVTDEETRLTIKTVHNRYSYTLDPHGAVGWFAAEQLEKQGKLNGAYVVVLETAHPAKFSDVVEPITGALPLPEQLVEAQNRLASSITIPAKDSALEAALLD